MLWYIVDVTSAESSVLVPVEQSIRCGRDIITSDTFFLYRSCPHSFFTTHGHNISTIAGVGKERRTKIGPC